jgi:hypothetical protein
MRKIILLSFLFPIMNPGIRLITVTAILSFWIPTRIIEKNSQQYQWLRDDLLTTHTRWKFAFFHHPPYTSGRHPSNLKVRSLLTPLFRKHGVDKEFSGHNHLY